MANTPTDTEVNRLRLILAQEIGRVCAENGVDGPTRATIAVEFLFGEHMSQVLRLAAAATLGDPVQEAEFFAKVDMEREVRAWLHDDPELIADIDIDAVVDDLLEELQPYQINVSQYYDIVKDAVERHDSRADER